MSETLTPTDEGRLHRPAGWAPVGRFAGRSAAGLLVVAAAGFAFALLLLLVRTNWSPLSDLDRSISDGLNRLVAPRPVAGDVLLGVSRLGGRPVLLWLVAVAAVLLLIRRRTRLALYLMVAWLGGLILDPTLKILVGRVRPIVDVPVATAPGNSFPSGHALGSMVVYGALALIFLPAVPVKWRKVFLAVPALIVLLIGFSRVALGVHFTTDVLAGWALGAAWLGVTAYAFRVWRRETGNTAPPLTDGLEPEAATDVKPAPDTHPVAHPWVKTAEIVTGWVLIFGLLYVIGYAMTNWAAWSWDDGFVRWLQTFRTERLDGLSHFWSKAGDTHTITLVSLIACPLALALWRQWRPVLFLVLAILGELTLFLSTSAVVGRPRPEAVQMDGPMPTSSFPSGHIAASMCIWAAIAILVIGRFTGWWRWLALAPAILMPAGVALSRMYRGMHHPTDVIGALILCVTWLALLWWVLRPTSDRAP